MKTELIDFTIPEWALSWLINADCSGMSDEDEKAVKAFETSNMILRTHVTSDSYFHYRNDVFGFIGSDVVDVECTCII
jgi:hypothetical protein